MTTVIPPDSSAIVSSTCRVDVGSSAEHGSSVSGTCGRTTGERATHSRRR
ncbi:hypothetical protein OG875_02615 [Streptomyces sp. NBC_01498]|nr:hypothetical protein [Streptomyces sp. NBC_01498]WTL23591.1 hypothetical protein OG875_02615 [Streptomyces sp. NBC_01498]